MSFTSSKSEFSELEKKYLAYRTSVNSNLNKLFSSSKPKSLYEPCDYILQGKGKRVRPMLVLLGAESISGNSKNAMNIALATEVFHNFTLIHDDIMDNADLRHGRATVHKVWNRDVAILSGDVMHAIAYDLILKSKAKNLQPILERFTDAAIKVCDGQAYDKEFELRKDVLLDDYLMMISYKTGRLISVSLELGGLSANATSSQAKSLRTFGDLIGQAFQIQDDLLDVMTEKSGKVQGGDLIEGKKTFLLLKAIELTKGKEQKKLQSIIDNKGIDKSRVQEIKSIFESCGVIEETQQVINSNFEKSKKIAFKLPNKKGREMLIAFASMLMQREF